MSGSLKRCSPATQGGPGERNELRRCRLFKGRPTIWLHCVPLVGLRPTHQLCLRLDRSDFGKRL
jgi:hypothetical protein